MRAFSEIDPTGGHRVWCIPKEDGDPYRTSIDNVTVQKWLYSPKDRAGIRSGEVEDLLSNLESAIAPLWRVFANGELIDLAHPPYRQILALFVAGLHARHPKRIEERRFDPQSLMKLLAKEFEDSKGRPESVAIDGNGETAQILTADCDTYRDLDDEAIRLAFAQGVQSSTKKLARTLITKVWTVLQFKDPILVTSDAPVMIVNPFTMSPGFRAPDTVTFLPVSPKRLLVMTDDVGNGNEYKWALDGMAQHANLTAWLTATKYLITSREPSVLINEFNTFLEREYP